MNKSIFNLLLIMILTISFIMIPSKTEASYRDNPKIVYYDLADVVYNINGVNSQHWLDTYSKQINDRGHGGKFKVIDTINVDLQPRHPAGRGSDGQSLALEKTGFRAMTSVIEGSKKLFISFSGSSDYADLKTALTIANDVTPGQLYQAQLYTNYIYKKFPEYSNYQWYFTGHSLGGWLASKVYLDMRAANWIVPKSTYEYGGGIGKKVSEVKGVFTFNPLPIGKKHVSTTQWNANQNGVYDGNINNMYILNEWLNAVQQMHRNDLAYFGNLNQRNTGISHYRDLNYIPRSTVGSNLSEYAFHVGTGRPSVINAHKLTYMKQYLRPWSQVPQ